MEGRFLQADDVVGLRAQAMDARGSGADAVFVVQGPLGDPIVLAAGLSQSIPDLLLGVRVALHTDGRHPAMLARDLTSLDLVCGGRSVLCFMPPFDDRLAEAIALCRALWQDGEATSAGPAFPVEHAVNRPRPSGERSPLIALDLTDGREVPADLAGVPDLLLHRGDDAAVCRMECT